MPTLDAFHEDLTRLQQTAVLLREATAPLAVAERFAYLWQLLTTAREEAVKLGAIHAALLLDDHAQIEAAVAAYMDREAGEPVEAIDDDGAAIIDGPTAAPAPVHEPAPEDCPLGLRPDWPIDAPTVVPTVWAHPFPDTPTASARIVAWLGTAPTDPGNAPRLVEYRNADHEVPVIAVVIAGETTGVNDLDGAIKVLVSAVMAGLLEVANLRPELRAAVASGVTTLTMGGPPEA